MPSAMPVEPAEPPPAAAATAVVRPEGTKSSPRGRRGARTTVRVGRLAAALVAVPVREPRETSAATTGTPAASNVRALCTGFPRADRSRRPAFPALSGVLPAVRAPVRPGTDDRRREFTSFDVGSWTPGRLSADTGGAQPQAHVQVHVDLVIADLGGDWALPHPLLVHCQFQIQVVGRPPVDPTWIGGGGPWATPPDAGGVGGAGGALFVPPPGEAAPDASGSAPVAVLVWVTGPSSPGLKILTLTLTLLGATCVACAAPVGACAGWAA
jgi:hypothetical protein